MEHISWSSQFNVKQYNKTTLWHTRTFQKGNVWKYKLSESFLTTASPVNFLDGRLIHHVNLRLAHSTLPLWEQIHEGVGKVRFFARCLWFVSLSLIICHFRIVGYRFLGRPLPLTGRQWSAIGAGGHLGGVLFFYDRIWLLWGGAPAQLDCQERGTRGRRRGRVQAVFILDIKTGTGNPRNIYYIYIWYQMCPENDKKWTHMITFSFTEEQMLIESEGSYRKRQSLS